MEEIPEEQLIIKATLEVKEGMEVAPGVEEAFTAVVQEELEQEDLAPVALWAKEDTEVVEVEVKPIQFRPMQEMRKNMNRIFVEYQK